MHWQHSFRCGYVASQSSIGECLVSGILSLSLSAADANAIVGYMRCGLSLARCVRIGQRWGLEGLWMMLWPLYCILCTLQFIGYKTKDWEAVSDQIIARLRARYEHNHDIHCTLRPVSTKSHTSFVPSAERLQWACDRPAQQATQATRRARTTRRKACSPRADLVARMARQGRPRCSAPRRALKPCKNECTVCKQRCDWKMLFAHGSTDFAPVHWAWPD